MGQEKYDEAGTAWKEFIEKYKDEALASKARYWLGQTYFVRKQFKLASQTFFSGFNADPNGPDAINMLYSLGFSFVEQDKITEACSIFKIFRTDFPDAPKQLLQNVTAERKEIGCK